MESLSSRKLAVVVSEKTIDVSALLLLWFLSKEVEVPKVDIMLFYCPVDISRTVFFYFCAVQSHTIFAQVRPQSYGIS